MAVLLVEDDAKIARFVENGLETAGFVVDHVQSGSDAEELLASRGYELAIVDVMLPGTDGLTLISRMRERANRTPVIILSAKRSVLDRVSGLAKGGDDYLTKPFAFSELLARVQALLRRAGQAAEPTKLSAGDVTVDLLARQAERAGTGLELQAKELALLELFVRNPHRILPKALILERVWDYCFDPQTNVVDVLVCRLRNKVDKGFPSKTIHTVRGLGYVFRPA